MVAHHVLPKAVGRRGGSMEAEIKIESREALEAWLQKQPRAVSVAIAARAALRVLPVIQIDAGIRDFRRALVLPVFRAAAISWAAAKYPKPARRRLIDRADAAESALPRAAAFAAARAADAAESALPRAAASAAARAADAAESALPRAAASAAARAADAASTAHLRVAEADSSPADAFSARAAADAAYAADSRPTRAALWSSLSIDATRIAAKEPASALAGAPLWPNASPRPPFGVPEPLWSLWEDMKTALLAANEDWDVWTDWYEDRLAGRARDEARELAYVRIDDGLWKQGPAAVNAEIKRRIDELETAHQPLPRNFRVELQRDLGNAFARHVAAFETPPQADQPAVPITISNTWISFTERAPPTPVSPELKSPEAPLPAPSPATRFIVQEGIVDVVPPTAWAGREAQLATYHARARSLALGFADELAKTNAEPKLEASVQVLVDVLGDDAAQLQPDQLRLASRTIAAKARAYGHPSARGELSVESVSTLFELADVLVSLQALVAAELEEHERAIRALDLTELSLIEAKEGLDLVAEAILATQEIVSDHAAVTFEAGATASDNAADKAIQIKIECDRILLTENLILALARELQERPVNAEGAEAGPVADRQKLEAPKRKTRKAKAPSQKTRRRAARGDQKEESWDDLRERFLARLKAKGPEAVADATLAAITGTIKHSPKSIPVLAGLIYAAISAAPALLAAGGGLSISLLWIGYELWRGKQAGE